MKTILQTIALMILFGMFFLCSSHAGMPQVSVIGEHNTKIIPNRAVLTIQVKNKAHSARATEELHQKHIDGARLVLTRSGIHKQDITKSGPFAGVDGELLSRISVTIRDLKNLASLVQALSARPSIRTNGLKWTHTDLPQLVRTARNKSLQDAKKKAQSMANALGTCLGEVIFIKERFDDTQGNKKGIPIINVHQKVEAAFRLNSCKANSNSKTK